MRRALPAAALLALAACAGARVGGASREPVELLVARGDADAAKARADRALARSPRDPGALLAAALLARRGLDPAGEARHLAALAGAAPDGPLALVALRRLADLADESPALARQVDEAVGALQATGRLAGLAAYRARVARVASAEVLGDHARAGAFRRENGAVSAWTIAGPFGVRRHVDLERQFPPDEGVLPASVPGPLGLPPRITRTLPAPDGSATLEGEPRDGDVFFLAADVVLERGGGYLVTLGTQLSALLRVDGAEVHARRAWTGHLPTVVHLPLELAPGRHRVVVKVSRPTAAASLHVAFSRVDGTPSDAAFIPTPPGPIEPRRVAAVAPVLGARALARALEPELGVGLAAFLAGRDAAQIEREEAKALLAEAARDLPGSAVVRAARAEVLSLDGTLDPQVARGRVEAELREALAKDPGHAEARLALAGLLLEAQRLDDADEVLAGLGASKDRPAALALRARAADLRGLAEKAEALVDEALRAGAGCRALDHARELAARRRAVSLEAARTRAFAECRDGRERLADTLRRRGDPARAAEALAPVVAARPWAIEPSLALAAAHMGAEAPAKAAAVLEALRAIWPRNARIAKELADAKELAGDPAGARAARERALLLDGSDLPLRRALALVDGTEVLAPDAEDARAAIRAYEAARRTDDTSSAMVLDAAAVEIYPGGAATDRTHQVIHVLDQHGVEQFGEMQLPPGAEVLALRTHKRDGRTLEPERAGEAKGSTSLAGLEPGDYVEIEYLRGNRGDGTGFAADPFFFRAEGTRLFRSSYSVSAPASLGLELDAHGMDAPEVRRAGDRVVVRSVALDVPALVPEPGSPPVTELMPFLHVGVGGGLGALHDALADAVADRARPTQEVRALAIAIRAEAGLGADARALVRAAYAHVARNVLGGQGGPFGEEGSVALSRGRGSRILALKALLGALGVRSRIAMARPFGSDPSSWRFPAPGLYSYALLRVEAGAETLWLDPGLRLAPFATIPSAVCDVEALVLPEPGEKAEVVRTPARTRVEDRREVSVRIALQADGSAEVEGEDRYHGASGAAAKSSVERLDASGRRQVIEAMLARSFRGVALSEATMLGEADPEAPLVVRWRGRVERLARPAGTGPDAGLVLDAPVLPSRLGARFVQVAARTAPLLLATPERVVQRIEIRAPEGFSTAAAAPRSIESPFGAFSRTEKVEGNALVREDRLELSRGRIAPDRYGEFAGFAAAVDAAEELPAVFHGGARLP
ncbi:MAG TPA: tetratricopeptide repeat protein [Anaeromyxobacter sp.]|nr:tetratricopeptide repeat protein [Anaeromyxobacter sp.]